MTIIFVLPTLHVRELCALLDFAFNNEVVQAAQNIPHPGICMDKKSRALSTIVVAPSSSLRVENGTRY
jgi:hypothetical protein